MRTPLVVGHRGCDSAPENTLPSFRRSLDLGAQMIELDVRLSADRVPVVFHDATLERLAGRSRAIQDCTAAELTCVDLGEGATIPTLGESLEFLGPLVPVNVEMKCDIATSKPLARAVEEVVIELGLQRRVVVSSFFHPALEGTPQLVTAPLFERSASEEELRAILSRGELKTELPFSNRVAVFDHRLVDRELVQRFESEKGAVFVYTVDEPEEMTRLANLGVAAIITNRPAVAVKTLASVSS